LWRPLLAVCKAYSPEHYEELLSLAYENAKESEKGDEMSDIEDTLISILLEKYEEEKQTVTMLLKDLTKKTQDILGNAVVPSYKKVQGAVENLGIKKQKIDSSKGVKYQLDLEKVREIAKERAITKEHICPKCNQPITEGQETSRDDNGNIIHKTCSSPHNGMYPFRRIQFCHLCGEDMVEGQDTEVIAGKRVHIRCYEEEMERTEEEMKRMEEETKKPEPEKTKESESSSGKDGYKVVKDKRRERDTMIL